MSGKGEGLVFCRKGRVFRADERVGFDFGPACQRARTGLIEGPLGDGID